MTTCFLIGRGPCDGQLVRGHLIPRQLLRREFPHGVVLQHGEWRRLGRHEDHYHLEHRSLASLIADERSFVPMCGGACGVSGHHGRFDSLQLRVARVELPPAVEVFAAEFGLSWWLERRYPVSLGDAA